MLARHNALLTVLCSNPDCTYGLPPSKNADTMPTCLVGCFLLKAIMPVEDFLEHSTPKQTGHVRSACFARWWRWKQRSLHAKRKQTMEDLGARAAQVLGEQGLVPDAKGLYTIQCPSCRSALACKSPAKHCSCIAMPSSSL